MHMTGDHHGRTAGTATMLVRAVDEILGTHSAYAGRRSVLEGVLDFICCLLGVAGDLVGASFRF